MALVPVRMFSGIASASPAYTVPQGKTAQFKAVLIANTGTTEATVVARIAGNNVPLVNIIIDAGATMAMDTAAFLASGESVNITITGATPSDACGVTISGTEVS